jgi:hypothetical protein
MLRREEAHRPARRRRMAGSRSEGSQMRHVSIATGYGDVPPVRFWNFRRDELNKQTLVKELLLVHRELKSPRPTVGYG